MATTKKTERKVVASSWAATIAAFIVGWIVLKVPGLSGLTEPLQALIVSAITGALAWLAGWMTRHAPGAQSSAGETYGRPGA